MKLFFPPSLWDFNHGIVVWDCIKFAIGQVASATVASGAKIGPRNQDCDSVSIANVSVVA